MTMKKRILTSLLCFALVLVLGGGNFLSAFFVKAEAAVEADSIVTDDLRKDASFNADDFPANVEDFSLQVIQVAESESGRLFVYVYRPSSKTADLKASYINMALSEVTEQNPSFSLYPLRFVNRNGVFEKYEVVDFKASADEVRHYNVASILRPFDAAFDEEAEATDDTNEAIAFSVGKCWSASWYNGNLFYVVNSTYFADVEITAVGSVRFSDGFFLNITKCTDAHFVAFKINNFDVEKIYSLTVRYVQQSYREEWNGWNTSSSLGEKQIIEDDIYAEQSGSVDANGWFGTGYEYSWDRILVSDDFQAKISDWTNEGIDFSSGTGLDSSEFVCLFKETGYFRSPLAESVGYEDSTRITEVGLLRLHFVDSSGKTYNLGVVSDIVSDDGVPDYIVDELDNLQNKMEDFFDGFDDLLHFLLLIVLVVLVILVITKLVIPFGKMLFVGIKGFFEILFYPFKRLFEILRKKIARIK